MIPIIDEQGQPKDFAEILDSIDFQMSRAKLTWQSNRVIDYVKKLHAIAGYFPKTPEIARYALSYSQLQTLHKKLKELNSRSTP